MRHSGLQVADYFIRKANAEGWQLTAMHLTKMVVVAHGWYLGYYGEPLLSEPVQGWKYGPNVESVYNRYRSFFGKGVSLRTRFYEKWYWNKYVPFTAHETELLDAIYKSYSKMDTYILAIFVLDSWKTVGKNLKLMPDDDSYEPRDEFIVDDYTIKVTYQKLISKPIKEEPETVNESA